MIVKHVECPRCTRRYAVDATPRISEVKLVTDDHGRVDGSSIQCVCGLHIEGGRA